MKTTTQSHKMDRIVTALLEHGSQERAAVAMGISPVTIWRWSRKPEFQEAYDQARREAFSRAMARAQYAANRAVDTLIHIMRLKENSPASRVRAADALLDHAGGAFAIDLTQRVQKLEHKDEESEN
jgi:uncharacterized protein YggE